MLLVTGVTLTNGLPVRQNTRVKFKFLSNLTELLNESPLFRILTHVLTLIGMDLKF